MTSYAYDDLDSRAGDFDRASLSHRDKEKMFRLVLKNGLILFWSNYDILMSKNRSELIEQE